MSLAREAEREEASERTSVLLAIAEYKLEFERRRRALGKKPPGFLLDPDGFIVGSKGLVGFRERASEEDKARWQGQRAECQQELKVAKAQLVGVKGRKRALLKREIETLGRVLAYIDEALAGSRDAMWILDQGTVFDRDDET